MKERTNEDVLSFVCQIINVRQKYLLKDAVCIPVIVLWINK